jgi:hypothetical protein
MGICSRNNDDVYLFNIFQGKTRRCLLGAEGGRGSVFSSGDALQSDCAGSAICGANWRVLVT